LVQSGEWQCQVLGADEISDLNIYRAANLLVRQHGENAEIEAAQGQPDAPSREPRWPDCLDAEGGYRPDASAGGRPATPTRATIVARPYSPSPRRHDIRWYFKKG
jgi:hypothetical protein